jgi:hypothetical protein
MIEMHLYSQMIIHQPTTTTINKFIIILMGDLDKKIVQLG